VPRVDDNNKAFPRVIWYFEGQQDTAGEEEGWMREGRGAVSHRFEASLQFMTRVGLRGTSRVKGG